MYVYIYIHLYIYISLSVAAARSEAGGGDGRCWKRWEGRHKATWKLEIQTPMAQGRSTTIVSMIQWTRTSRLSIRIFLSRARAGAYSVRQRPRESHRTVQALREGRNQRVGSLDASKHGHPVDPFFPCKGGVSAYLGRNQNVQDLQQPKAD